jgi:hypothetical protein
MNPAASLYSEGSKVRERERERERERDENDECAQMQDFQHAIY